MAADLYRVVAGTTVSEPLDRAKAVTLRLGGVRVIRDADYTPPKSNVYRGEAARKGEVHYGFSLLPTACDQPDRDLPPQDRVSRRSSEVTCERCLTALAGQSGGSR